MNYVTYAIPFFILLMAIELFWGHLIKRQTYRLNDTLNSLTMGLLSRVVDLLRLGIAGTVIGWLVSGFGVAQITVESAWTWLLVFVAYDFCYYWKHRMGHQWRILWASHVAHHQSEAFNLSTALRQTSTDYIGFIFYLPLYLVGLPVQVVMTVGSLNLIYQFWVHTEHIRRLGPLEWIFVTPSNHRVHHARNPEYVDRNFGGVFVIWDRLFGTFTDEQQGLPCRYGITHALHSWNPVWANLHIWIETGLFAWRAPSWQDKISVWFKPPSWAPADRPNASNDWQQPRYDPAISNFTRCYCFLQYWFVTAGGLAAVLLSPSLPYSLSLTIFGAVATSLFVHGSMLEGRQHALKLESLRLGVLAIIAAVSPQIWPILSTNFALYGLVYCLVFGATLPMNRASVWLRTVRTGIS